MNCQLCYEHDTSIKYKLNHQLKPFPYCYDCLVYQLDHQWSQYIHQLKTSECEQNLKRLITLGPPRHFRDAMIENHQELESFDHDGYLSAKLKGALSKEKRDQLKHQLVNCDLYTINHLLTSFQL